MSLSLVPPTLPEDYCNLTQQEQANLLIGGTQIIGSADTEIVFSIAEPSVNDRDKAWGKLNSDGTYTNQIYKFAGGQWGAENLTPPSGDDRIIWRGPEADIWSRDGGDGSDPSVTAPTDYTGAMWERDTDFDGRSPMGVGTISGITPPKNLALNEEYGEGSHILVDDELPSYNPINTADKVVTIPSSAGIIYGANLAHEGWSFTNVVHEPNEEPLAASINTIGKDDAHQNTHPVLGAFFAKRTARKYLTP